MMLANRPSLWIAVIAAFAGYAQAESLQLAGVFTDNAVLQRDAHLPIWGTTTPRETVTVRFAGQTHTAQASGDGSWRVDLAPLPAERVGRPLVVESAEQRIEIQNVLVGEVWYASGQSNMQFKLAACMRTNPLIAKDVEAAPAMDGIRMLRINEEDSPHPKNQLSKPVPWQIDRPINRHLFSAVAYFFARELYHELDVPVGILEGSWGGKPIEGFIPRQQFDRHDALRPILSLADHDQLDELAAIEGGVLVRNTTGMPGRIYHARITPIAPYGIRGFIWYQGESNAGRGEDPRNYRIKMQALVDGWRTAWGQPALPFYFVQLPAFREEATGWIRLREEQRRSLEILGTGMAVTIDLRDADIHPANKLDVGNRLARWALANTYHREIPFSGPLFRTMTVEGDAIRVEFEHAQSGLMVARKEGLAPPKPTPEQELAHFELADAAGNWYPARATIHDTTIRVQSASVSHPRAVRYACSGDPENANLYNHEGLPASPFCSDLELLDWVPWP